MYTKICIHPGGGTAEIGIDTIIIRLTDADGGGSNALLPIDGDSD